MFAPFHYSPIIFRSKSEVIFRRLIIDIVLICIWNIWYTWADSLESALMPGQVIQGHAKWEEDCAKRHKLGSARIATNHAGSLQCCEVAARDGHEY